MSVPAPVPRPGRRPTATSRFGVGRRESHDASEFYERFTAPTISDDEVVCHPDQREVVDRILLGDIRDQPGTVAPNSVALVVTSPPYYSGKEYETAVGRGHVPASYLEYLAMLSGVFAVCAQALEPGGRIAVNVANLGRKPYRSLSADVIRILEDELGLLLRGEVIWQKAKGAAGNCAWGTYQKPGDPVLRDLTERVIIASKGRFDRALRPSVREHQGYPSKATIFRDEFLEATVDVWEIPPASATRIGHPAPFPVELPQRLIDLYTYQGDVVLDPFMGSGTTAVAALRTDRHFLGYDTQPEYVEAALQRIQAERSRLAREAGRDGYLGRPVLPASKAPADPEEPFHARGVREGRRARELARWALEASNFVNIREKQRLHAGVEVSFVADDQAGNEWLFDVSGAFTSTRTGLQRADTLWKALGKATVVNQTRGSARYVLMTTDKPSPNSAGGRALSAVTGVKRNKPVRAVIGLQCPDDLAKLRDYGQARRRKKPSIDGRTPPTTTSRASTASRLGPRPPVTLTDSLFDLPLPSSRTALIPKVSAM